MRHSSSTGGIEVPVLQALSPKLPYRNSLSLGNQAVRTVWNVAYVLFYRPSPRAFHGWRRFLLRLFGASIAPTAHAYPRARVFAPWNLTMKDHSCLADDVDCYSVDHVILGVHATVSQYAYLCTATHDYTDPEFPLVTRPIVLDDYCWVAAGAFVGPGVVVGSGAVIGARGVVVRNVEEWTVVAGNPAKFVKRRIMRAAV